MTTSPAPVAPPSILTMATDEYIARVLSRIPDEKRAVLGLDASNAGVVISAGARVGEHLTGVGFVGKAKGQGWTYGTRIQFVF